MAEPAQQNDRFQVRVVGEMEGQQTNNILYFQAATPIDDVELRLIVALVECFQTHLIPVASSAWQLKQLVWKKVNPTLGVENIFVPTGQLVGQGAATALPSFCSAVVSIRSDLGGRSRRGRMYLPGIPEAATTVSAFDTNHAFWAALVAFCLCVTTKFVLGDPPGVNTFQMMIYSRKLGGSTFPLGTAGFTAVKRLVPVQLLGTTRSRKVGQGA